MLSAEQLIIVAYTRHGEFICRQCGESGAEIMGHAVSAYEAGEYAGADGLTCEDCGKEIIEAYEWTCPTCGKDYIGEEAETAESEYGYGPNASHKCSEDCNSDEDEESEDE
jgi:predicted RNA-binding Zn-ribbon protein involved in translation (DUF1610 family)